MLKILYIGNFRPIHSTENHVRQSLETLGHSVIPLQEDKHAPSEIMACIRENEVNLVLYTRTWGIDGPSMLNIWHWCKQQGIPTASYHLDLYYGLKREGLYNALASKSITGLQNDPFWRTQYVFTVDGDPEAQAYFESLGINHIYLRAGVFNKECYIAPNTGWRHDVAFVGNGNYGHPEWPYRQQLIEWLKKTYGDRFGKYGPPENTVRNEHLNELYANVKVVVGDSLTPGFNKPGYWSDRVYETVGRGGFLIHPYVKGLEEEFKDGAHLAFYEFNNFEMLKAKIDYYLENEVEREGIRNTGQMLVAQSYTYINRMTDLLNHIAEREPKVAARK